MSPVLRQGLRAGAIAGLVAVLFVLGVNSGPVYQALSRLWEALLPTTLASGIQQGTSRLLTQKSLPAMLTYGILYTSLCLLLIGLLLNSWRRVRGALVAYWLGFALCTLLIALGKATHQEWAYLLARQVINGIVSPLPVIVLVPLLQWQKRLRETQAERA